MRENLSAARAAELLMQKDNITLLCHRRPDGDTVGSAFALYYALRELGKEVRVLCADALPKQYDYLYGDYTPSRVLDWPVEYVVTVDVATAGMLGGLEEKYGHMVDLCIDHHPSNRDYSVSSFGCNIENLKEMRNKFEETFQDIPAYLKYFDPDFKIRVGNYRNRLECIPDLHRIRKIYPASYAVKTEISLDELKRIPMQDIVTGTETAE